MYSVLLADTSSDGDAIYFCGNSLGLLTKRARQHVLEELDTWSTR
jgi:kynureninase